MTIKEEMMPEGETLEEFQEKQVNKQIKKYETIDRRKADRNNDKERIDKLENCLKDKDKRIKKLEEYFWSRNCFIQSVFAMLACFSPWICLFGFTNTYIDTSVNFGTLIFALIGFSVSIIVTVVILVIMLDKIWEK